MVYETIDMTQKPFIKLLLMGVSGTGKTSIASQFPSPVIFNFDNNLTGVRKLLADKVLLDPPRIVNPTLDDNGKLLPAHKVYDAFWPRLEEVCNDVTCKTIVIDALTSMSPFIIARTLGTPVAGATLDWKQYQAHNAYLEAFLNKLLTNVLVKKHVIIIAHECREVNDETNTETYDIVLPSSKMRASIGRFFSDVWHTQVSDFNGKPQYKIRSVPSKSCQLYKSSLNIPMEFEWSKEKSNILSLLAD